MRIIKPILVLISVLTAMPALAAKHESEIVPETVGQIRVVEVIPDLARAVQETQERFVWREILHRENATFVKAHFVGVNLRAGDVLTLRGRSGRIIEEIRGRGPKNRGTFWGLSSFGDVLVLELAFSHRYETAPFRIDRVLEGDSDLFDSPSPQNEPESICSPADFEDVICYEGDAAKWANVQASVGVMNVGSDPSTGGLWCSGSNVSSQNYLLTNQHCVEDQGECDNSEFVFKYYRTSCNSGGSTTPDWQSFRCDEVLASEPFINCDAGPGDLDFTLATVIGDPAATFGHVTPDPTPLVDGENLYIIQHPSGRPHEIAHGGGSDVDVDGSVLRYYTTLDTEGGSSGSPIFREADHQLVGLHHCGGCSTPGTGNRGMLMSEIYPLISDYLCQEGIISLRPGGHGGISEVLGNGDTVVDPGETWQFTPTVSNSSCDLSAPAVTAEVEVSGTSATPIEILDPSPAFGTIAASTSNPSTAPVRFQVASSIPCGSTVSLDLVEITTTGPGGPWPASPDYLSVAVGEDVQTTLFMEDFSAGLDAWTVVDGGTGTGPAQTWTLGNPGSQDVSGLTDPYVIADSDEHGAGSSGFLMDEILVSPTVDVSGYSSVSLQYTHHFKYFSGGADEQGDVAVCSAATGGDCTPEGASWVSVAHYSGADSTGTISIDVTAHAAADLRVRFHYYDGDFDWFWAVDDVYLMGSNGLQCTSFIDIFADGFESGDIAAWSGSLP